MSDCIDRLDIESTLFAAPTLEEQGMTIDETFMILGLVNEPFYDSIRGAKDQDIARLEAVAGLPLPPRYAEFLALAGESLGPFQIQDSKEAWDFRPATVASVLEAKSAKELKALQKARYLAIAKVGSCYEYEAFGTDDICLYLETETGWVFTDDGDREMVYDCLQAFFLEWGFQVLDPRMAAYAGSIQCEHLVFPPGLVTRVHDIVARAQAPGATRYVGGFLGVYPFYDSVIIVKACTPAYPHSTEGKTLWVYAHCGRRVKPNACAAAAVLGEIFALGMMRHYKIDGSISFGQRYV